VLERCQDLSATQVSPNLLDVLCRLLQAGLAIWPWDRPQGGKGGAETHDIERVVGGQRPHTQRQGAPGLGDRIALHRAGAVEQEKHLIATARNIERLRMEGHHGTERAVRLTRHVCHRLVGVLGLHEEHEVAVQYHVWTRRVHLVAGQGHGGAVGMRRSADGVARRLDLRHVGVTNLHGERQTVGHHLLGWRVHALPVRLAYLRRSSRHIAG
jgi:hypothetical protein